MRDQGPPQIDTLYQSYGRDLYKLADQDQVMQSLLSNPMQNQSGASMIDPSIIGSGFDTSTSETASGATKSGKTRFDNTESGYILGVDQGVAKFYIGDSVNYMNWNGATLIFSGSVTVAIGSSVGGFVVFADNLQDGPNNFGLSSVITGGDDVRIWAGATFANRNTAPFRVTEGGVLIATLTGNVTGNVTGNLTGNVTGNASTATALQTARAINGVNFDGTAAITVTAAAGTLTGTTLNASVVTSSLTSVGTITSGVWTGTTIAVANGGSGATTLTGILKGNGTSAFTAIVPLAGTKIYYVSDTNGGPVDRKLTFIDGVLTAEV